MEKCWRCGFDNKHVPYKTVCDNDCDTDICSNCHAEWYADPKTRAPTKGHHPSCGVMSDVEVDDFA